MTRFLRDLALAVAVTAIAGSGELWGQTGDPAKNTKAAAYYHATLGHLYSELAAQYGGRSEFLSKAIDNYKLAMKEDPGTSYLSQELADLYLQSGQVRTAISEFEEVLKRNPDDLGARRILARFYAARISQGAQQQQRMNEEMLKAAIAQYEKIGEKAPDDLDNWMMLGRLQKLASNSLAAEKAYQKALDLDPENEEALTGLALVYGDQGLNEKASLLLKRVSDKNPSLRTLTALAATYEQMKDFKGAAEAYRRALDLNRDNMDLKRAYAQSLFTGEDYDEALKVFQEISAEEPGDLLSALRLSQIYRQKRDFVKAREYANKATALDATNVEVRYNEVSLYEAEGKITQAVKVLKEVLASLPKRSDSLGDRSNRTFLMERLAFLYRNSDQVEQAVATFREIAEADPDSGARAGAQIIDTYRTGKDFASAAKEAAALGKRYPNDRLIKLMTGNVQADLGQFKEAEVTLKSLFDGKSDRDIWISLTQVYEKEKNWTAMAQAVDQAGKLSESAEEKEAITFLRGAMFERMKRYDQAEAEFRNVLKVNPNSASALNYLGYMLADRNVRLNEALDLIRKAVDQEPANSAYLDSLGWVYYRMGKLEEAEESLQRAIQQYGGRDATVYDHLGDVYMSRNKLNDAIKQWERSLKEWQATAPSEADPAEIAKIQKKLEKARVRLASEHVGDKRDH
jgi:tetratricopeptide (TPR) repeat protein